MRLQGERNMAAGVDRGFQKGDVIYMCVWEGGG